MSSAPTKIPHLRWYIAILLCLASELNYFDRQALSVLAVQIQKDLGFSSVQYGQITSAFLLSYAVMYAVSGRIIDLTYGAAIAVGLPDCGIAQVQVAVVN